MKGRRSAKRPLRRICVLGVLLCAIAVLAPAGAAADPAPATSLNIATQADWIHPFSINVYVTVNGTGGFGFVNVNVDQATSFGPALGNGGTQIFCDGQNHTYAVGVFGGGFGPGFQLGDALADATANCPTSGFAADSQTIKISKP